MSGLKLTGNTYNQQKLKLLFQMNKTYLAFIYSHEHFLILLLLMEHRILKNGPHTLRCGPLGAGTNVGQILLAVPYPYSGPFLNSYDALNGSQ